ncbi:FAD-dependent oxidoreductase [Actinoplanes sp. NPDC051633]|uniref:FAD-dependent oxidoreductase n=1 Tax=Actinoplanes sp. NPDC051633 TaxID=3155670 RepID=UPI003412DAFC
MAKIVILGAGIAGLTTAMMLDRDGHDVTVLERDLASPAGRPWDDWQRPGVNQFRQPHYLLPRWWTELRAELPDAAEAVLSVGATTFNPLTALPAQLRGEIRESDARFDTVTARRPVLEAALAGAAGGVRVSRGVRVTGVRTDGRTPAPRVTGVTTTDGTVEADLVVDCGGRRSALPAWLTEAGAAPPAEERADAGFVYYSRHFTAHDLPEQQTVILQTHDSITLLTLPADHGTWSVVLTASAKDKALRALREPAAWSAALREYPLAAHWADAEPITGVDVMAGIEDRLRRFVVDGEPIATGVVAVGDAWACTNPSLGRGASFAIIHARVLRDVLRETGAAEHDKLVRRFDEATARTVEPLYRATTGFDAHRLAEIDGDIAGVPYRTDDRRWAGAKALFAAALRDQDVLRAYVSVGSFLTTPDEVFADPALRDRIFALGLTAPRYPLPGPSRAGLLAAISRS